jgi:hypothetical protein
MRINRDDTVLYGAFPYNFFYFCCNILQPVVAGSAQGNYLLHTLSVKTSIKVHFIVLRIIINILIEVNPSGVDDLWGYDIPGVLPGLLEVDTAGVKYRNFLVRDWIK